MDMFDNDDHGAGLFSHFSTNRATASLIADTVNPGAAVENFKPAPRKPVDVVKPPNPGPPANDNAPRGSRHGNRHPVYDRINAERRLGREGGRRGLNAIINAFGPKSSSLKPPSVPGPRETQ